MRRRHKIAVGVGILLGIPAFFLAAMFVMLIMLAVAAR